MKLNNIRAWIGQKLRGWLNKLFPFCSEIISCQMCKSYNVRMGIIKDYGRLVFWKRYICKNCGVEKFYKEIQLKHDPTKKLRKIYGNEV